MPHACWPIARPDLRAKVAANLTRESGNSNLLCRRIGFSGFEMSLGTLSTLSTDRWVRRYVGMQGSNAGLRIRGKIGGAPRNASRFKQIVRSTGADPVLHGVLRNLRVKPANRASADRSGGVIRWATSSETSSDQRSAVLKATTRMGLLYCPDRSSTCKSLGLTDRSRYSRWSNARWRTSVLPVSGMASGLWEGC